MKMSQRKKALAKLLDKQGFDPVQSAILGGDHKRALDEFMRYRELLVWRYNVMVEYWKSVGENKKLQSKIFPGMAWNSVDVMSLHTPHALILNLPDIKDLAKHYRLLSAMALSDGMDLSEFIQDMKVQRYEETTSDEGEEINADYVRNMYELAEKDIGVCKLLTFAYRHDLCANNKVPVHGLKVRHVFPMALCVRLWLGVLNKNLDNVNEAIEDGADVNIVNERGETPLMHALEGGGDISIARLLFENGANPNVVDKEGGSTALMFKAQWSHINAVALLLEYSADPDVQNQHGMTALMYAAKFANIETVELLLMYGANPHIQDKEGATALMYAERRDDVDEEMVELLCDAVARRPSTQLDQPDAYREVSRCQIM